MLGGFVAVVGMYAFALYGPTPRTTEGLLLGIAIVFAILMVALYVVFGLVDDDTR